MPPAPFAAAMEADELAQLKAQWGPLATRYHTLTVDDPFLTGRNQLLVDASRRAEICYVMHRGDLAGGVLLHVKSFYPPAAYRLPTGGIHVGESVMDTLAREIEEETGLITGAAADQVTIERCLGVVAYSMAHRSAGRNFSFATYHFVVAMPEDAVLCPRDAGEQIAGWQWRAAAELSGVADTLEQVGKEYPEWADWGRYRSLSHRFVAAALSRSP